VVIVATGGVLLTVVLGSNVAPSEPAVRWEAPSECGSARELQGRVTQPLGALEPGIGIVGRVRHAEGLYVLELDVIVGAEHQRRTFSAIDCRTLLDAAALVSSAALGPDAMVDLVPEPEPVPPPPAAHPRPGVTPPKLTAAGPVGPSRTPSPATDAISRSLRSPRRSQWLFSTRIGAGYDGTLATPVGSLGFGHTWSRWRVQALVDVLGNRARSRDGTLGLRVVTVGSRACGVIRPRPWIELLPCVGLAAGPAVGQGRDVPNARVAVVPWIASHQDFGLQVTPRRWLALGIELSNYVMLGRPRFILSDQRTLYRVGPAGTRGFFTVELRFSATD
jgi:hypothetical protein